MISLAPLTISFTPERPTAALPVETAPATLAPPCANLRTPLTASFVASALVLAASIFSPTVGFSPSPNESFDNTPAPSSRSSLSLSGPSPELVSNGVPLPNSP